MNFVKLICEELNIEPNEEWEAEGLAKDTNYKLTEDGQLLYKTPSGKWDWDMSDTMNLLTGRLKPAWHLERGEYYWILDLAEEEKVWPYEWHGTKADNTRFKKGLIFKTKKEAIEAANKMLNVLKED